MKKENSSEAINKKGKTAKKMFNFVMVTINLILVGLMFLGESSCIINPNKFLLPSYIGLIFPFLVLFNFLFLILWIIRLRWFLIIPLTALLFSLNNISGTFPISFDRQPQDSTLKVLSYNIRLFNFFAPVKENDILKYIAESDADIICLQEFGYSQKKGYLSRKDILDKLKKRYPYHHFSLKNSTWNTKYGVATFSKYRIIKHEEVKYETDYNTSIYSDILFNKDTIRIFNCHLESNRLTENDKILIDELSEGLRNEKINAVVSKISKKMSTSYKIRAKQVNAIAKEIEMTSHPIILCGDFNDVPVSYAYNTVKGDRLIDAYTECGSGYGYTFNEKFFRFRIDQIMHSKDFKAYNFNIEKIKYSDHYPISCEIEF